MIPVSAKRVIENEELLEFLPHREKMLLISRITEYDINIQFLRSEFDVSEKCMFYDPGLDGIPAFICFEFMAQSVSLLSGLTGKYNNRAAMIGFILSVSSLKIDQTLFRSGDKIEITVNEVQRLDNVSVFQCNAVVAQNTAVQAKLMVMDIDDINAFFPDETNG
jgi:predicted hotdog family 3-hydroxylacyl-ACP dehydratase